LEPLENWNRALSDEGRSNANICDLHVLLAFDLNDEEELNGFKPDLDLSSEPIPSQAESLVGGLVFEYYPATNCTLVTYIVVQGTKSYRTKLAVSLLQRAVKIVDNNAKSAGHIAGCNAIFLETEFKGNEDSNETSQNSGMSPLNALHTLRLDEENEDELMESDYHKQQHLHHDIHSHYHHSQQQQQQQQPYSHSYSYPSQLQHQQSQLGPDDSTTTNGEDELNSDAVIMSSPASSTFSNSVNNSPGMAPWKKRLPSDFNESYPSMPPTPQIPPSNPNFNFTDPLDHTFLYERGFRMIDFRYYQPPYSCDSPISKNMCLTVFITPRIPKVPQFNSSGVSENNSSGVGVGIGIGGGGQQGFLTGSSSRIPGTGESELISSQQLPTQSKLNDETELSSVSSPFMNSYLNSTPTSPIPIQNGNHNNNNNKSNEDGRGERTEDGGVGGGLTQVQSPQRSMSHQDQHYIPVSLMRSFISTLWQDESGLVGYEYQSDPKYSRMMMDLNTIEEGSGMVYVLENEGKEVQGVKGDVKVTWSTDLLNDLL